VKRSLFLVMMLIMLAVAGCSAPQKKKAQPGQAHYMLGLSHYRQQQLTPALKEFLLAVKEDPKNADFQNALAMAYQFKQAYPEAEQHYLKAIELSDNSPEFQNNLGALYLDMQRWDDAIKYFRLASSNLLFGNPEVALTGIGFAYFKKGDPVDAVGAYQEAIKNNARYPVAYLRLGEVYYEMDKWQPAIEAYQEALKLVPDYLEAHYKLGLAYMKTRQNDKAREEFDEVVRLAPVSDLAKMANGYLELLK